MANFNGDGITEIHHTADVSIRVAAGSLEQLFLRSARGMYTLSGIQTARPQTLARQVQLSAIDLESLLVAFLSELLYFVEEERIAFHDFDLVITATSLNCSMTGSQITGIAKPIKAVTFHNLKIHALDNGFEVTLVFDV
jgi:SHS2 domain-containing protein